MRLKISPIQTSRLKSLQLAMVELSVSLAEQTAWREKGRTDPASICRMAPTLFTSGRGPKRFISDSQGHSIIPTYVSFPDYGDPLAGLEAQAHAFSNPKGTVCNVRRLVGRNFSDPEVQEAIKDLPYEIVEQDGRITIKIHTNRENKVATPEEV
ncbi:Hsp70 protein-domain-containing protein [Leptodontidium sp. MPI-SDFR-AT-0119]|nr:Hsp70 protein-domain-containing protein [Leptodontidium sp. MPI-SDFR-AT-0119]